jgi:hypothetical protein
MVWARESGNRRLIAFVLATGARALAKLGDTRGCLALLDQAGHELAQHPGGLPDPAWLTVFDEAALRGHHGSCLLDLGRHLEAIEPLTAQDDAAPGVFVRNRSIWLLDRAQAHLELAQVDEACVSIRAAWDITGGTSSPRITHRLSQTLLHLDRWEGVPQVATLTALLRARPTRRTGGCGQLGQRGARVYG